MGVNEALRLKADHDRRLRAVDEFLAAYEAEHGEITDDEIRDAACSARSVRSRTWQAEAARPTRAAPRPE